MTIAIPSHHRSELILTHSLNFALNQLCADPADIYIFISDKEQAPAYQKTLGGCGVNLVNADTDTVRDKFNFIHSYFKDGRDVLVIEDDVKGLVSIAEETPQQTVEKGFALMHQYGKSLWGIYPSSNKYFMRPIARRGFNYIVANMYGFKADGDERLLIQEHSKTDYERSILYAVYKKGSVRLDYVAAKTNNYTTKGGMQMLDNRAELESTAGMNIVRRFPRHAAIKKGTKSKYDEIKLLR
jgi:hypothetical protein